MKKTKPILIALFFSIALFSQVQAGDVSLYLSPETRSLNVGESFWAEVRLNTGTVSIGVAQASLSFPVDKLRVRSISKTNSIFNLWIEEPALSGNIIKFVGGARQGFKGDGRIFSVKFEARGEGIASVNLTDARVLSHGAEPIDVLSIIRKGNYEIKRIVVDIPERIPPVVPRPVPVEIIYYCDNDGDGFISLVQSGSCDTYNCLPAGCQITPGTDCDDVNPNIHPEAIEICDNIDNNCNEKIDEDGVCPLIIYYCDNDGDGYISSVPSGSCDTYNCLPVGCQAIAGRDLDDTDPAITTQRHILQRGLAAITAAMERLTRPVLLAIIIIFLLLGLIMIGLNKKARRWLLFWRKER